MKKTFAAIVTSLIFNIGNVNAQSILIANDCRGPIETPGNITINPVNTTTVLTLKNADLKSTTLTFGANISKVEIIGNVIIKCNQINITAFAGGGASEIVITGKSGNLTFEYPSGSFSNTRNFTIEQGSNVKLKFIPN